MWLDGHLSSRRRQVSRGHGCGLAGADRRGQGERDGGAAAPPRDTASASGRGKVGRAWRRALCRIDGTEHSQATGPGHRNFEHKKHAPPCVYCVFFARPTLLAATLVCEPPANRRYAIDHHPFKVVSCEGRDLLILFTFSHGVLISCNTRATASAQPVSSLPAAARRYTLLLPLIGWIVARIGSKVHTIACPLLWTAHAKLPAPNRNTRLWTPFRLPACEAPSPVRRRRVVFFHQTASPVEVESIQVAVLLLQRLRFGG